MSAPAGQLLGSLLKVSDGPLTPRLLATLQAVDAVHGDGNVGTVSVDHGGISPHLGMFFPGSPPRIAIRVKQLEPGLTLLHEVGHLLDNTGIEPGRGWRSLAEDPRLAPWWRAVSNSDLYLRFVQLSGQDRMRVPKSWGSGYDYAAVDQSKVKDRLEPRELFARSYAQYIVVESGEALLRQELDHARSGRQAMMHPEHWPDDDFEPIRVEMDLLIRSLGWRI